MAVRLGAQRAVASAQAGGEPNWLTKAAMINIILR